MDQRMLKKNYATLVVVISRFAYFAVFCMGGCAAISYFDSTTYKNLTDMKPEISALYDNFTSERIDTAQIDYVRLKLAQIYEYEKGKAKNSGTTRQIQIIQEMFERHVKDRFEKGKWTKEHLENKKENIDEAFDMAIKTEGAKNKN